MIERYRHKIKTAQQLADIFIPPPASRTHGKVVLCHGVFDVVHPGHVRHLLYAKSKAAVLIVSVTADAHVNKGPGRPHVPQDLRALNLAAFEMVDYVIINPDPTPLATLKLIQPDFYAKGFEYSARGNGSHTAEEAAAVRSYGGEMIFTPGDVVYSSTQLLNLAPPSLKYEKLAMLMQRHGLGFNDLTRALEQMKGAKVHVVGDTIVDSYTHCAMAGGSSAKTPTLSVLYEQRTDFVGGAAVVAKHLKAAGAAVTFSTVLGGDVLGKFVLDDLEACGIDVHPVIDPSRPTTCKNAFTAKGYRLLKVDTVDNRSISDKVLADLHDDILDTASDAVVFSDFRHGIFNRRTIPKLTAAVPVSVYKIADSQVASRWGNIADFQNFDLITPNEREARFALGDQDSGIRPLASKLYDAACCKLLMLKLGERGILTCTSADHAALDSFFVLDSFAEKVTDAVGAGDALLAYATLAMLVSNEASATILGSVAAALECERDGNVPVAAGEMGERLKVIKQGSIGGTENATTQRG